MSVGVEPMAKPNRQQPVQLAPRAQIWLTDDGSDLAPNLAKLLGDRGYRVRLVKAALVDRMKAPSTLDGLILLAPQQKKVQAAERFLFDAFKLCKLCAKALQTTPDGGRKGDKLLISVSRNGGDFGCSGLDQLSDAYSGGLAGLVKTLHHEWPQVLTKAVDLSSSFLSAEMAAGHLCEQILLKGPLEVGLTTDGLVLPVTTARKAHEEERPLSARINAGDLVVVTGGGRGVTQRVAQSFGQRTKAHLLVLGRSPEPEVEPEWLAALASEKELKAALCKRHPDQKPKDIEKSYQKIMKSRQLRASLQRYEDAKVAFTYVAVDVRDRARIAQVIRQAQKKHGPVRGLIHGAGILADRLVVDKTPEQFESVYSTKVHSLRSILAAIDESELRLLGLFSSSTARYGRKGQADYAVANEVLNKLAQYYSFRLPRCRAVAFGWGPWDGGMVDEGLKRLFAEEGIGVIGLDEGATFFCDEALAESGESSVELVIIKRMPEETKGVGSRDAATENQETMVWQQELSLDQMPILQDHVINGKGVVPLALIIEWVHSLARKAYKNLHVAAIADFKVVHGARVAPGEQLELSYYLATPTKAEHNNDMLLPFEIRSQRLGRPLLHYKLTLVMSQKLPSDTVKIESIQDIYPRSTQEVYRDMLFHGKRLQGIERIQGHSNFGMTGLVRQAPLPGDWLQRPHGQDWGMDPLIMDSAFQMMVLWCQEYWGMPSLPLAFSSCEFFVDKIDAPQAEVRARIVKDKAPRLVADLELVGPGGKLLARIRGYVGIGSPSLLQSFQKNKVDAARGVIELRSP